MRLASLFSGGKDSTFAIFKAMQEGHEIKCLVTIFPQSEESRLLHFPNINMTKLQAEAMKLPHIFTRSDSVADHAETTQLENLLQNAKKDFQIQGLVHGGLSSKYQKDRFEKISKDLDLEVVSPLWHIDQKKYLYELLETKFRFIITSVSAGGLDESWLGKEIKKVDIQNLEDLSSKYGFNLAFEGGEAETFVINCPLFYSPIKIIAAEKFWDGYRGRFEITEAVLEK